VAADLKWSLAGTVVYVVLFVTWVALFQATWQSWGDAGYALLIWQPDNRWWAD
jgi:hypothetical protein